MTEKEKDELKTEVLMYVGRDFIKKGEGNKGSWKMYRLKFDVGGDYPRKFTCFDKTSDKKEDYIQPDQMEEGEYYKILYKVGEFTSEHGTHESRTVITLQNATEAECTKDSMNNNKHKPQSRIVEFTELEDFTKIYIEKTPKEKRSKKDFVGAYMLWCKDEQIKQQVSKLVNLFEVISQ